MAKTDSSLAFDPSLTDVDAYLQMVRNKRMADALNLQANGPMDYDPKGFISPAQILAKGLAGIASRPANDAVDRDQINQIMAQQRQQQQMFGIGPQALAQGLQGQSQPMTTPTNALGRGFDNAQQAWYMSQHNPEVYKEIVGKNLELTNNQKDYAGQMPAWQAAQLAKDQASGVVKVGAGDTILNYNQVGANGQPAMSGANKIENVDAGNRNDMYAVDPVTKQRVLIGSTGVTPKPTNNPNAVEMADNEAAATALTIFAGGKEAKQILSGGRANNAKVQSYLAQLSGNITNPKDLAAKFNLNMNTGLIDSDQQQKANAKLVSELGSTKSPTIPFNTAISHMATLDPLITGLENGQFKDKNAVNNFVKSRLGNTAVPSFEAAKTIVGDEITKAVVGGQMALADREKTEEALKAAQSPQQLRAVINTFQELMAGKLGAIEQVWIGAGKDPAEFRSKHLEPEAQKIINRIRPIGGNQSSTNTANPKDSAEVAQARDWLAKNPNAPVAQIQSIKQTYGIQ